MENEAVSLKGKELKRTIDHLHQPTVLQQISEENEKMQRAINIISDSPHFDIWGSLIDKNIFLKKKNTARKRSDEYQAQD